MIQHRISQLQQMSQIDFLRKVELKMNEKNQQTLVDEQSVDQMTTIREDGQKL